MAPLGEKIQEAQGVPNPPLGSRMLNEGIAGSLPDVGILGAKVVGQRVAPKIFGSPKLFEEAQRLGIQVPSAVGITGSGTLGKMEYASTIRKLAQGQADAMMLEASRQLDAAGGALPRTARAFGAEATDALDDFFDIYKGVPKSVQKYETAIEAATGYTRQQLSNARRISTYLKSDPKNLAAITKKVPAMQKLMQRAHLTEAVYAANKTNTFDPMIFAKSWDDLGPEAQRLIYGKDYKAMASFVDVARTQSEAGAVAAAARKGATLKSSALTWAPVAAGIGSALSLAGLQATAPGSFGPISPSVFYLTTGAMTVSPYVVNKLLLSEAGARWLTGAMKTSLKWRGAPQELSKMLGRSFIQAGLHSLIVQEPIVAKGSKESSIGNDATSVPLSIAPDLPSSGSVPRRLPDTTTLPYPTVTEPPLRR